MVEFTITGKELWAQLERAVEKVNTRLRRAVGILVRPADLPAMIAAGVHHRHTSGPDMCLEHPDDSARDAVGQHFKTGH